MGAGRQSPFMTFLGLFVLVQVLLALMSRIPSSRAAYVNPMTSTSL